MALHPVDSGGLADGSLHSDLFFTYHPALVEKNVAHQICHHSAENQIEVCYGK